MGDRARRIRADRDDRAGWHYLVLGFGLLVVTAVLSAVELYLELTQATPAVDLQVINVLVSSSVVVPPLAFSAMGLLVVWRQMRNRVGWTMCAVGVIYSIGVVTTDFPVRAYAVYHLKGAAVLVPAVIGNSVWGLFALSLAILLLIFPTGAPLSAHWGRVLRRGLAVSLAFQIVALFAPGRLSPVPLDNPLALPFVPAFFGGIALLPSAALLLLGVVGVGRRLWLSRGIKSPKLCKSAPSLIAG